MSSRRMTRRCQVDPQNDLFWRFDMRRLTAEEIRDSILAVSGKLNLKMYGPGVYPEIPREVLAGQSVPGNGWGTSPPEEQAAAASTCTSSARCCTPIPRVRSRPKRIARRRCAS